MTLLILMAGVGAAWLLSRRAPPVEPAPAHPSEMLPPQACYDTALAMSLRRQSYEALPYFRRALSGINPGEDFYEIHLNYAGILYHAGMQTLTRRGCVMPRARSSIERASMIGEALHELDRASALAPHGKARALIEATRARILAIWGLPWDAFVAYRLAQTADPSNKALADDGDHYMNGMERPEVALRALPEDAPVER